MPIGIICSGITPARGNHEHRPLSGAVSTGLSFDWSDDADSSSSGAATGRFAATATVATFIIWRLYLFCETASSRLSRFVNSD